MVLSGGVDLNNDIAINHNVSIVNRERFEATGILDVTAFSENEIEAEYQGGCISVDGENLKIEEFSAESGRLVVVGYICGLYYYGKTKTIRRSLFRK